MLDNRGIMLDTAPDIKPAKKKRRGNPDRYRDYMRNFMREYRAKMKSKVDPKKVNLGSSLDRGYEE